jgi:pimeloyl-ACP methyl ester carboxylesterase
MPGAIGQPTLIVSTPRGEPRGVAVVLHGGRENSVAQVRARHLAVVRMQPFATALRRAGASSGLVVARVRYRVRGWNGAEQSPVGDVEQALGEFGVRFPNLPVALVGHSMGGRAAVYAAGAANVRAVVLLAPWLEEGDPVETLRDRRVLIAHGDRDRVTSARASAAYAHAAEAVIGSGSMSFVGVTGESHAMVRRARVWHELSTGFVLSALFGADPDATAPAEVGKVLTRALAGQLALVV